TGQGKSVKALHNRGNQPRLYGVLGLKPHLSRDRNTGRPLSIRNPPMRSLRLVALLVLPAQVAFAQQPAARGRALSLEEAISTARKNNPIYLQTENGLRIQDAQVRAAYGQLLPRASVGFNTSYTQGGTQYYQGVALGGGSTDNYSSSYSVGL